MWSETSFTMSTTRLAHVVRDLFYAKNSKSTATVVVDSQELLKPAPPSTPSSPGTAPPSVTNSPVCTRAYSSSSRIGARSCSVDEIDEVAFKNAINMQSSDKIEPDSHSSTIDLSHFNLHKVIGKGSFGKVTLVSKKSCGTLYAMKTLKKAQVFKRGQAMHTATERSILANVTSPFLVSLKYAFQTSEKLYMVMDYMGGGELYFWLKKDRTFSETRTKLYIAEVVLGIDALHSVDVIYRDLKAENILLDLDGHIKLTDFGLAKAGVTGYGANGGTRTSCGSLEYFSPEMINQLGHGKAVDWWSVGILTYELLFGIPPFSDSNTEKLFQKILSNPIQYPTRIKVSEEAKMFMSQLLRHSVGMRLGSNGTSEVMEAPWLADIDFERVLRKDYEPDFKPPTPSTAVAVDNFDKMFTRLKANDSIELTVMSPTVFRNTNFGGFEYRYDTELNC